MLTGQTREEIGGLRWSEIDFDRREITFSALRTKNHREHVLSMSYAVVEILEGKRDLDTQIPMNESGNGCVFGTRPNGFFAWSKSKAALDTAIVLNAENGVGVEVAGWRLQDLRRSMATVMADRLGVLPHIIEAVLNHVGGHRAGVAGIYNRARYQGEMRAALDRWAEHLTTLTRKG